MEMYPIMGCTDHTAQMHEPRFMLPWKAYYSRVEAVSAPKKPLRQLSLSQSVHFAVKNRVLRMCLLCLILWYLSVLWNPRMWAFTILICIFLITKEISILKYFSSNRWEICLRFIFSIHLSALQSLTHLPCLWLFLLLWCQIYKSSPLWLTLLLPHSRNPFLPYNYRVPNIFCQ